MKAVKIKINSTRISSKINIKQLKWSINYLQSKIKKNIYLNNEKVECILIEGALKKSDGSVTSASKSLKINRTTLIEKMKKYSIPRVGND